MASETEMRAVILHAAEKLNAAKDTSVVCNGSPHGTGRPLGLTVDVYVAMAYAESILRLLASYLKVEEVAYAARSALPMPPRDGQGRFLKPKVAP